MQRMIKIGYESLMIILVMFTIITIWTENTYNSMVNLIVWIVFFSDFTIRLLTSKEKWQFIKQNPFHLIAIIPLDQFFQLARIVRLFHLFRLKTITKYYVTPYLEKLTYKSMTIAVSVFLSLLLAASLLIWNLEHFIVTFFDAVSVVCSHLLFFGHQLFVIENVKSIWILTGITIIGVVIQGLALQWFFNKVEEFVKRRKEKKSVSHEVKEIR
ncbi:voltage-gated potassium channel [Virgibacillus natechei]|uniref:Voltage-gated potassium channel n=1 Tax=Virgibacillus natechei TaxID=1216297 RepID=A0ABS4IJA4_9BACI|nr:transporter [Virgibacillus natechei]MBP1971042.1 voltage-gated potassium channel [Virgibacillus natechei]UZD12987.1 transporter [Virgibacillus natechei]